jgi:hypothetical protein
MKKRERRKEGLGGRKKKKQPVSDAGFGRKKRRNEGLVIIWCSCVYFVNLSLLGLG